MNDLTYTHTRFVQRAPFANKTQAQTPPLMVDREKIRHTAGGLCCISSSAVQSVSGRDKQLFP